MIFVRYLSELRYFDTASNYRERLQLYGFGLRFRAARN